MPDKDDNSRRVRFSLSIPSDVYLSYYVGAARAVVVKSLDGRTIQFPAGILRKFITHDGIQGMFEMDFDANNKLVNIRRVVT